MAQRGRDRLDSLSGFDEYWASGPVTGDEQNHAAAGMEALVGGGEVGGASGAAPIQFSAKFELPAGLLAPSQPSLSSGLMAAMLAPKPDDPVRGAGPALLLEAAATAGVGMGGRRSRAASDADRPCTCTCGSLGGAR
jgi:hypothetical protein